MSLALVSHRVFVQSLNVNLNPNKLFALECYVFPQFVLGNRHDGCTVLTRNSVLTVSFTF